MEQIEFLRTLRDNPIFKDKGAVVDHKNIYRLKCLKYKFGVMWMDEDEIGELFEAFNVKAKKPQKVILITDIQECTSRDDGKNHKLKPNNVIKSDFKGFIVIDHMLRSAMDGIHYLSASSEDRKAILEMMKNVLEYEKYFVCISSTFVKGGIVEAKFQGFCHLKFTVQFHDPMSLKIINITDGNRAERGPYIVIRAFNNDEWSFGVHFPDNIYMPFYERLADAFNRFLESKKIKMVVNNEQ